MTTDPLHQRLQQLIGNRFDYLDEVWILIEVLSDMDSVVLRRCKDCQRHRPVQQNAYGAPNRRVDGTLSLPISNTDGDGYSDDLLVLLEGRQASVAD